MRRQQAAYLWASLAVPYTVPVVAAPAPACTWLPTTTAIPTLAEAAVATTTGLGRRAGSRWAGQAAVRRAEDGAGCRCRYCWTPPRPEGWTWAGGGSNN